MRRFWIGGSGATVSVPSCEPVDPEARLATSGAKQKAEAEKPLPWSRSEMSVAQCVVALRDPSGAGSLNHQ